MARPTLKEKLDAAIAAGNLEEIKVLVDKMSKVKIELPKKRKIIDEEKSSENFIVSARDKEKAQKYVGEDGAEGIKSKRVPFNTSKHKNTWKDDLDVNSMDLEFDKKVHKNGVKRGPNREKAKKIKVVCVKCGEAVPMWPGEITTQTNWICPDCISMNARRFKNA